MKTRFNFIFLIVFTAASACSSPGNFNPTSNDLYQPSPIPETPTFTYPATATPSSAPIPPATSIPRPTQTLAASYPSCEPNVLPFHPEEVENYSSPTPLPLNWQPPISLRYLAKQRGLRVGAAAQPRYLNDPGYTAVLAGQFNLLTPENAMNWKYIHPKPGQYNFSGGDALVSFAIAHRMQLYGHTLVWEQDLPEWIMQGEYTRQEWIDILCRHIKTVVGRYRGLMYAWNVVNEPFDDQGQLAETVWLKAIGPDYISLAFRWAHEADPRAKLVLNDHQGEGLNRKSQAIFDFVYYLRQSGVPVDAVGLQMHVWLGGPPRPSELAANMQRLADIGLDVHITEMDVRTQYSNASAEEKIKSQAETYRQALQTCLDAPTCKVFTTWGFTDRYSWIPGYTGNPDMPLLFDEAYQPKPAYFALLETLQTAVQR